MATDKSADNDKRTSVFQFLTGMVIVIFISLLLSIIVEWIGMTFFWQDQGSKHSLSMLSAEINYVNKDFTEQNILGYRPIDVVEYSYTMFYGNGDGTSKAEQFIRWVHEPSTGTTNVFEKYAKLGAGEVKEYLLAAFYITLVFTVRLSILVLSLPLFILVAVLAIIDGFAKRDVRRWTNGRESGFRYHYAKALVLPFFFITWVIYLSIPFSIHPNIVILPLVLATGFSIREMVSWFKKYL